MSVLIDGVSDFLGLINLSEHIVVIIPISECVIFTILFLVGLFVKKIRLLDKSALSLSATASVSLLAAKSVLSDDVQRELISSGAFFVGIAFLLLALLTVQNRLALRQIKRKSRRVDYLGDDLKPSLTQKAFERVCKRRPDELNASKGFIPDDEPYAVNYSEILSFIRKIEQKSPELKDEKALDDLKADVKKFSGGNLSDAERKGFSDKLSGLIKIMAKYDVL